jgi:hypothetical protein
MSIEYTIEIRYGAFCMSLHQREIRVGGLAFLDPLNRFAVHDFVNI